MERSDSGRHWTCCATTKRSSACMRDLHGGLRQINPTGKMAFASSGKSDVYLRPSHGNKRGDRDRHDRAVGCGGCRVATDERGRCVRRNRAGPTPRCWRQVGGDESFQGRWWQESRSPGRPRISRKAIAWGRPVCSPLNLYARGRISLCILPMRPRVQRASGLPCALYLLEGQRNAKLRAISAARSPNCAR